MFSLTGVTSAFRHTHASVPSELAMVSLDMLRIQQRHDLRREHKKGTSREACPFVVAIVLAETYAPRYST